MCNSITKRECLEDAKALLEYIDKPLDNPTYYLKYREELIKKCQDFVKNAQSKKISDEEYEKFKEDKVKDLKRQAESLYFMVEELQYQRNYYKDEYEKTNILCDKYKHESKELEDKLMALYNSKRYRYAENIRKVLGMNKK